ncbi:MAG: hypothetical protein SGARI_004503, partial [Bacillariaceae sp.]
YHFQSGFLESAAEQPSSEERRLVWGTENEGRCDDETFRRMQDIRGPTMDTCLTGNIIWDPDRILYISYLFTSAVEEYLGSYISLRDGGFV